MKILKKLLTAILVIALILVGIGVGGYFYVKSTYDIDLIQTINQLKTLNEPVSESKLCPNAFTDDDMASTMIEVNGSVPNFITYSEQDGYAVDFETTLPVMLREITLTDKQVGALAQTVFSQESNGKIDFGGKSVDMVVKQMQFTHLSDNSVLFNTVISIDLTPFKADMPNKFPFTYLKQFVPSKLYVSSTVQLEKGATAFSYAITHDALKVNNLSKSQTESLFRTLDIILKVGNAESWNVNIGKTIADGLIGNSASQGHGFAYTLHLLGATDYSFTFDAENSYFNVLK